MGAAPSLTRDRKSRGARDLAPESWKAGGGLDGADRSVVGAGQGKAVNPTLCLQCPHVTQSHPDRTFQRTDRKNASHSAEEND